MGLEVPVLNSCCWMSLRTGALVTGVLQVSGYTLYFVQILILLLKYSINGTPFVKFDILITDILMEYVDVLNIVFSAFLIIGVMKENSSFVTAWLLVQITHLLDLSWNMVITSFWFFHISFFIEELLFVAIQMLFTWVGYSYYTTMPTNNKYIL